MKGERLSLARRLAWVLPLLSLAGLAGLLALQIAGCDNLVDLSHVAPAEVFGSVITVWLGLGFSLLGWLIIVYRPENRIGWLLCSGAALFMLLSVFGRSYAECAIAGPLTLPASTQIFWLSQATWPVSLALLLGGTPLLFPDGHFLSPRWARFGQLSLIWLVLMVLFLAIWPGPLDNTGFIQDFEVENPYGLNWEPTPVADQIAQQIMPLSTMLIVLIANASLVLRWRRSSAEVRQQLKWLATFLSVVATLVIVVEIVGVFVYTELFEGWFYLIVQSLFWIGYPVVIGLAIFKYRLYDIDIIIRKTLVYGLLTGTLLLVYIGSVVLLQSLFAGISGQRSPAAVVISTLAIYALFRPLRRRFQELIDRRFYRRSYDASKTLTQCAATARDEVDLDQLTGELVRVVQETMQPESLSLWIRAGERATVGGPGSRVKSEKFGVSHER